MSVKEVVIQDNSTVQDKKIPFGNFISLLKIISLRVIAKEVMRVLEVHLDSKQHLMASYQEAVKARWENPNEVKAQYKNASILKGSRKVFGYFFVAISIGLLSKSITQENGFYPIYWFTRRLR